MTGSRVGEAWKLFSTQRQKKIPKRKVQPFSSYWIYGSFHKTPYGLSGCEKQCRQGDWSKFGWQFFCSVVFGLLPLPNKNLSKLSKTTVFSSKKPTIKSRV